MKKVENRIRNVLQLDECTFDESVKRIGDAACMAFCACECSRNMAVTCTIKEQCKMLAWYKECFCMYTDG